MKSHNDEMFLMDMKYSFEPSKWSHISMYHKLPRFIFPYHDSDQKEIQIQVHDKKLKIDQNKNQLNTATYPTWL